MPVIVIVIIFVVIIIILLVILIMDIVIVMSFGKTRQRHFCLQVSLTLPETSVTPITQDHNYSINPNQSN